MSMFYCHRCQHEVDSDWIPCVEDPDGEFWLMCDEHEEKCARCDKTLSKHDDHVDTNFDGVCDGCWDKIVLTKERGPLKKPKDNNHGTERTKAGVD